MITSLLLLLYQLTSALIPTNLIVFITFLFGYYSNNKSFSGCYIINKLIWYYKNETTFLWFLFLFLLIPPTVLSFILDNEEPIKGLVINCHDNLRNISNYRSNGICLNNFQIDENRWSYFVLSYNNYTKIVENLSNICYLSNKPDIISYYGNIRCFPIYRLMLSIMVSISILSSLIIKIILNKMKFIFLKVGEPGYVTNNFQDLTFDGSIFYNNCLAKENKKVYIIVKYIDKGEIKPLMKSRVEMLDNIYVMLRKIFTYELVRKIILLSDNDTFSFRYCTISGLPENLIEEQRFVKTEINDSIEELEFIKDDSNDLIEELEFIKNDQ
jgi:hypothetical protein